ncbi:MAG: hypothetical protein KBC39_10780 [Thermotogae bacterium]|nr:hypothetical protein [Thermotogota bacterium]HPB88069.1 RAMP superfamily CRISPR-associated protein [Thermotogota bacterium]HPH11532.1 RAMP superfamily CRISPR-associated protein [Thermotogota bacterium]HPX97593.1 RAMP superfamily CRISPR-associated protein [Thermotogota bacterium]HQQ66670.1 RAMP superfamily CRISPR-associated protein [Thermotogota bacterium]
MNDYWIRIETLSPLMLASGEGATSLIDTDIVFDEYGLPSFPARRLKGLLRESATHIHAWLSNCKRINIAGVEEVFGNPNQEGCFLIDNGELENYEEIRTCVQALSSEYGSMFNDTSIKEAFTVIRQQTALTDGIAKKHSLRTVRALRKNRVFYAPLTIHREIESSRNLLALSCRNLRYAGLNRNRGFGRIGVSLIRDREDKTCLSLEIISHLTGMGVGI